MDKHGCGGVALCCIDYRLRRKERFLLRLVYWFLGLFGRKCRVSRLPEMNRFLDQRFPGGYDLISIAGGIKRLLADEEGSKFILDQLHTSTFLHAPEVIALFQHEDCGAYGGSEFFGTLAEETSYQQSQLEEAEAFLI